MKKILIIEDEEAIADLEKDYLELSGYEVAIETSGNTGLERALREDFNLYILGLGRVELDFLPDFLDMDRNGSDIAD